MSTDEIKKVIASLKQCGVQSPKLAINGYVSSDGTVTDYVVELLPAEGGYKALVEASLKQLTSGDLLKPPQFSMEDWFAAKTEQSLSWSKTINGTQAERQFASPLVAHADGYWLQADKPETVILRHLKSISRQVKQAGSRAGKVTQSAAKTLAKQYILESSPLGHYIGQLNLTPGKVASVTIAS